VEQNLVIASNIEFVEEEFCLLLSQVSGVPVGFTEKVAIGSGRFRVLMTQRRFESYFLLDL